MYVCVTVFVCYVSQQVGCVVPVDSWFAAQICNGSYQLAVIVELRIFSLSTSMVEFKNFAAKMEWHERRGRGEGIREKHRANDNFVLVILVKSVFNGQTC